MSATTEMTTAQEHAIVVSTTATRPLMGENTPVWISTVLPSMMLAGKMITTRGNVSVNAFLSRRSHMFRSIVIICVSLVSVQSTSADASTALPLLPTLETFAVTSEWFHRQQHFVVAKERFHQRLPLCS